MNQRSGGAGIFGLIGIAAAFFLLSKFMPALAKVFLLLCGLAAVGVIALVIAVMAIALRKPKKTPQQQMADSDGAVLKDGRIHLMDLRRCAMQIKDDDIRRSCETICGGIDKILRTLKDHPEDIRGARRFFGLYLPMLSGILQKYRMLEESGVPMADAKRTAAESLRSIEQAVNAQYAALFDNDVLDLTVEAEVLLQMCKRDGLLEDDFTLSAAPADEAPVPATVPPQEADGITLTF